MTNMDVECIGNVSLVKLGILTPPVSPACLFIHGFSLRQLMFSRNCKEHPQGVLPCYTWSASASFRWRPSDGACCLWPSNYESMADPRPLPRVWAVIGRRGGHCGAGREKWAPHVVSRPQTVGRGSVGLVCNRIDHGRALVVLAAALWKMPNQTRSNGLRANGVSPSSVQQPSPSMWKLSEVLFSIVTFEGLVEWYVYLFNKVNLIDIILLL
jgi:hypothetical protein